VIAHRCLCLRVTLPAGVYDVAGVTILGLPACVKDPLPDRCSALVGWLPCCAARVDERLLALSAAVAPHTTLLAYAVCRAFSMLHGRLLDEGLHLAVQLRASGVEGAGMAQSSVAAAMSF
jgi:hypothetical protein